VVNSGRKWEIRYSFKLIREENIALSLNPSPFYSWIF